MHLVDFARIPTECGDCKRAVVDWKQRKCTICGHTVFVCPFAGCFDGTIEAALALHMEDRHGYTKLTDFDEVGPEGWLSAAGLAAELTQKLGRKVSRDNVITLAGAGHITVAFKPWGGYAIVDGYARFVNRVFRVENALAVILYIDGLQTAKLQREAKIKLRQDVWLLSAHGLTDDEIAKRLEITAKEVWVLIKRQDKLIDKATQNLAYYTAKPWVRRLREAGAI